MANRHKAQFKRGGRTVYSGAGSKVAEEADSTENKKDGGRVHGKGGKKRLDRRARGGAIDTSEGPLAAAARRAEIGAKHWGIDSDVEDLSKANDEVLPKGEHRQIDDYVGWRPGKDQERRRDDYLQDDNDREEDDDNNFQDDHDDNDNKGRDGLVRKAKGGRTSCR
jgi:hypothetical protein